MESKIQEQELIGRRAKLENYSSFGDYIDHCNEIGIIKCIDNASTSLPIVLEWIDGYRSRVSRHNIILINDDWDI